ncbi:hypothetical protein DM785_10100 [Deinococcus actinosclerus]|nr:hypothetical protein DM785_10100 [Deinococcus actinosclerus]
MSRGPGRVQRGILEALERGPLTGCELARTVQAEGDSTRRALRRLEAAGRVACLGFTPGNSKRWCLADELEARASLWPAERAAHLGDVMGARFMRSFRRALVAAL